MSEKTCCSLDCPKTDNKIISQICEIFYPYGSKARCNKVFQKWLKEEKEVQEIHNNYLKKEVK